MKTVWLIFSICDANGQSKPSFAIELRSVSLHGLDGRDIILDLLYIDGVRERIRLVGTEPTANWTTFFRLGSMQDYVAGFRMIGEFPSADTISREVFNKRCGQGMLLD